MRSPFSLSVVNPTGPPYLCARPFRRTFLSLWTFQAPSSHRGTLPFFSPPPGAAVQRPGRPFSLLRVQAQSPIFCPEDLCIRRTFFCPLRTCLGNGLPSSSKHPNTLLPSRFFPKKHSSLRKWSLSFLPAPRSFKGAYNARENSRRRLYSVREGAFLKSNDFFYISYCSGPLL